jgi:hypothetical protein
MHLPTYYLTPIYLQPIYPLVTYLRAILHNSISSKDQNVKEMWSE